MLFDDIVNNLFDDNNFTMLEQKYVFFVVLSVYTGTGLYLNCVFKKYKNITIIHLNREFMCDVYFIWRFEPGV